MGIRIASISVKDCGPIEGLDESLSDVNLIYGRNESGKSFLVEFLIGSLFKNHEPWGYLREEGQGKVVIEGIGSKPVRLTRGSKKKLEALVSSDLSGLPSSFARLLVVRAGEVGITPDQGGIDRDAILDVFSFKRVLDEVENKIGTTVAEARIGDGYIQLKKKGMGKEYDETRQELENLDKEIERVTSEYEIGRLRDLRLKRDDLDKKRELLINAKRYRAFRLAKELRDLKAEIENFPEDALNRLDDQLDQYGRLKDKVQTLENNLSRIDRQIADLPMLEQRRNKLIHARRHQAYLIDKRIKEKHKMLDGIPEEELVKIESALESLDASVHQLSEKRAVAQRLEEDCKHVSWLESARENYSSLVETAGAPNRLSDLIFSIAIGLLILGMTGLILSKNLLAGLSLVASAILSVVYGYNTRRASRSLRKLEELKGIRQEFKRRFGTELSDIATLDSFLKDQRDALAKLNVVKNDLVDLENKIGQLRGRIIDSFGRLGITDIDEPNWKNKLTDLKKERAELTREIQSAKDSLARLDVEEGEYEETEAGIEFSRAEFEQVNSDYKKLKDLADDREEIRGELDQENRRLSQLRQEIITGLKEITGREIDESQWRDEIKNLKRQRDKIEREIKQKQGELEGLGIPEHRYLDSDPGISFSQQELDSVENQLEDIDNQISQKEEELTNLKGHLCRIVGKDMTVSWEELIEGLYAKREAEQKELAEIEAIIIAGKTLYDTIAELRQEEDQQLEERINSTDLANLVFKLTRRYKALSLEESEIVISDDYNDFYFKDLSTGAKEQVLLAIRIAFARKVLGNRSGFLILDDAFQHSDYEKRPILVDTLFDLAEEGWQIIYLTMDDHIRDLFRARSSKRGVAFREIDL